MKQSTGALDVAVLQSKSRCVFEIESCAARSKHLFFGSVENSSLGFVAIGAEAFESTLRQPKARITRVVNVAMLSW